MDENKEIVSDNDELMKNILPYANSRLLLFFQFISFETIEIDVLKSTGCTLVSNNDRKKNYDSIYKKTNSFGTLMEVTA